MSEAVKISACIITFNEERNLPDCLASLKWVDEILVVDSGSTDRTVAIAEAAGCRTMHQDFLGHVKQKELAIRRATHQWVLCLDADERLEDGAEHEVRQALSTPEGRGAAGYFFPRHTFYLGGWINHGGWWPQYRLRLFDRERGGWTGMDPHDRVEVRGKTGKLKSEMAHYNYRDMSHHLEKINAYSTIMAKRRFEAGHRASLMKMLFNPVGRFLRMYILKRGFLDGKRGLVIAVIAAYSVFMKYAKLWEMHQEKKP